MCLYFMSPAMIMRQDPVMELTKRINLETRLKITPEEVKQIIRSNTLSQDSLDRLFNQFVKCNSQLLSKEKIV